MMNCNVLMSFLIKSLQDLDLLPLIKFAVLCIGGIVFFAMHVSKLNADAKNVMAVNEYGNWKTKSQNWLFVFVSLLLVLLFTRFFVFVLVFLYYAFAIFVFREHCVWAELIASAFMLGLMILIFFVVYRWEVSNLHYKKYPIRLALTLLAFLCCYVGAIAFAG